MSRNDRSAHSALGDASLIVSVALVLAVFVVLLMRGPGAGDPRPQAVSERGASQEFFADYVGTDGRVIRHDQGDDTVSEGQAYALRLALGDGDAGAFDQVWSWTREHLLLDSGLLAWRWQDGAVVDAEPVADADLDVAVALAQASDRFGRADFADDARQLASAVLDHETVEVGGRLVLVAGPWAVADRVVNPSYLAPCDDEVLASHTDDPRWLRVRDSSVALLGEQLATGLPSDWSVLDAAGSLHATAQPGNPPTDPARYGLDAARVPARLWGCDSGRALAGQLWPRVQHLPADGAYSAYALDGAALDTRPHPLGLIAGALNAGAVGERSRAEALIGLASRLEKARPSYYGAAWLALAEDQLATVSIDIPSDVAPQEIAAESSAPATSETTPATVPPVWWPAPPTDPSTVPGSLTVIATDAAPLDAGLPVPSPGPPHPTPLVPPTTTTSPPPTTVPPTTVPPTTAPPTTVPPTTEPPTTAPPTTEPPTTTTEPPTTEPPTTTTTAPGGS